MDHEHLSFELNDKYEIDTPNLNNPVFLLKMGTEIIGYQFCKTFLDGRDLGLLLGDLFIQKSPWLQQYFNFTLLSMLTNAPKDSLWYHYSMIFVSSYEQNMKANFGFGVEEYSDKMENHKKFYNYMEEKFSKNKKLIMDWCLSGLKGVFLEIFPELSMYLDNYFLYLYIKGDEIKKRLSLDLSSSSSSSPLSPNRVNKTEEYMSEEDDDSQLLPGKSFFDINDYPDLKSHRATDGKIPPENVKEYINRFKFALETNYLDGLKGTSKCKNKIHIFIYNNKDSDEKALLERFVYNQDREKRVGTLERRLEDLIKSETYRSLNRDKKMEFMAQSLYDQYGISFSKSDSDPTIHLPKFTDTSILFVAKSVDHERIIGYLHVSLKYPDKTQPSEDYAGNLFCLESISVAKDHIGKDVDTLLYYTALEYGTQFVDQLDLMHILHFSKVALPSDNTLVDNFKLRHSTETEKKSTNLTDAGKYFTKRYKIKNQPGHLYHEFFYRESFKKGMDRVRTKLVNCLFRFQAPNISTKFKLQISSKPVRCNACKDVIPPDTYYVKQKISDGACKRFCHGKIVSCNLKYLKQ